MVEMMNSYSRAYCKKCLVGDMSSCTVHLDSHKISQVLLTSKKTGLFYCLYCKKTTKEYLFRNRFSCCAKNKTTARNKKAIRSEGLPPGPFCFISLVDENI